MSNNEIIAFLKKQKGAVCGRLRKSQLNTSQKLSETLKRFLYALALTFLPFLGFSQSVNTTDTFQTLDRVNTKHIEFPQSVSHKVVVTPNAGIVGFIRNEDYQRLSKVKVTARQHGKIITQAKSDSSGLYDLSRLDIGFYELEFALPGYKTLIMVNTEVTKAHLWNLPIVLNKINKQRSEIYVTKYAPKNHGRYGEPCIMGAVINTQEEILRIPGHPFDLIKNMFPIIH